MTRLDKSSKDTVLKQVLPRVPNEIPDVIDMNASDGGMFDFFNLILEARDAGQRPAGIDAFDDAAVAALVKKIEEFGGAE